MLSIFRYCNRNAVVCGASARPRLVNTRLYLPRYRRRLIFVLCGVASSMATDPKPYIPRDHDTIVTFQRRQYTLKWYDGERCLFSIRTPDFPTYVLVPSVESNAPEYYFDVVSLDTGRRVGT